MRKRDPKSRTALKKKADALFGRVIRARGSCERCGRRANLQTSHIIPRRYLAVRWDEDNALCLDGCHHWWHVFPIESRTWFDEKWPGRWERLRQKSLKTERIDLEAVVTRLEERLRAMGL